MRELELESLSEDDFATLAAEGEHIVLGDSEEGTCFWQLPRVDVNLLSRSVIVQVAEYHLKPKAYVFCNAILGVGVRDHLWLIAPDGNIRACKLPFMFYEVIFEDSGGIVVEDEISFVRFAWDGSRDWECGSDLKHWSSIKDGYLTFLEWSGRVVRHRLSK